MLNTSALFKDRKPYNAFEHLWRSLFLKEQSQMAMFTFYGDESYGNIDAYVVAGYIATVEQWAGFEREWCELGQQEGFTVLHKRKLEHNIKEFEWAELTVEEKRLKKQRINKRACGIILRRVNAGFSAAVTKSVWQNTIAKSRWAGVVGKSFYTAGVFACLNLISTWIKELPRREPIDGIRYVFEEGAEGRGEAEQMLIKIKASPEFRESNRMSGYSFESKKDIVPLQAADFLAYEGYRQLDNRIIEGIKRDRHGKLFPVRGALSCLLQQDDLRYADVARPHPDKAPTPHYGLYLDEPKIVGLLTGLEEHFPLQDSDQKLGSIPSS